jgi:Tol biopolymer transport system component
VIARDLDLSGLFHVIDRDAYIEGPRGWAEEINFQNWSTLERRAFERNLQLDGDDLTVEVRLFDVARATIRGNGIAERERSVPDGASLC